MSLSVQFFSLLSMVATGVVAAAMIDMIGTGISHSERASFIKKNAVLIEVVGWILVGCEAFAVLYIVRDGAWRIYDPLAQMSGLFLYVSFIHRPFRVVGRIVFLVFIKPIVLIFKAVYSVVKYIAIFVGKIFKIITKPFVSIFRKHFRKYFKIKIK